VLVLADAEIIFLQGKKAKFVWVVDALSMSSFTALYISGVHFK
jgi:hypothetical protein